MGLLKFVGKTIGTATLIVTGTTSTVLKGVSDAMGFEIGSSLFSTTKDASFNGIRSIWSDKDVEKGISKVEKAEGHIQNNSRYEMARTARQAALSAKNQANSALQNGDSEKYSACMEKYDYYMAQYERYK